MQTTVSRDIQELGLVKVRGASGRLAYAQPGSGRRRPPARARGRLPPLGTGRRVQPTHLVVVFTPRGFAALLAEAIDQLRPIPMYWRRSPATTRSWVLPRAGGSPGHAAGRAGRPTSWKEQHEQKTAVLAYSGGLDTTCIIAWLKELYGYDEVVAVLVDVGQEFDLEESLERGHAAGADDVLLVDRKESFAAEQVARALKANALYEGKYPLVSALSRPVIAQVVAELALELGAEAAVHGCTGKGNDQLRFELAFRANYPGVKVIAPLRDRVWTRDEEIEYATSRGHPDSRHEELRRTRSTRTSSAARSRRGSSRTRGRRRRRSRTSSPPTRTPRPSRPRS